ncbi:Bacterial Ig-like domain (group 2) [Planctomycetes bacterium MalM25]|nr:Bacterial Ig-like domain (group 2) [Planctomycetes bacterium MalM25]
MIRNLAWSPRRLNTLATVGVLLVCLNRAVFGDETGLAIYPDRIDLTGARDRQSLVVQMTTPTGETHDVTSEARITLTNEAVVSLSDTLLTPVHDGESELTATYQGTSVTAPVSVRRAEADATLDFCLDVMPIFTKAGCNVGKCHGSARGQDGFRLSLFGFDVTGDHHRLIDEMPGRRINLNRPEASLLLTKAIGQAPHTGGQRFDRQSESYRTLVRWIKEGAPGVAAEDPAEDSASRESRVVAAGLELMPPESVLVGAGASQRLTVRVHYTDGTTRDVTRLAAYLSSNDNSVEVDDDGVMTAANRGEAFVMARFDSFTVGVPVIVLSEGEPREFVEPTPHNEIDRIVHQKLRKLRIRPSEVCSDEQFLRRLCLDLTGLTPTIAQRERFLSADPSTRRSELIDELIASDAFTDVWAMRLGEALKVRTSNQVSYKALLGFHEWVRQQIATGEPLDQLFAEVLASTGGTFDTPATNFFQIEANTLQLAENVAQSYLGMRVQCAQCHNHPFDRWTTDDYYGFAAFFSQVGFKQSHDPREFIVYDSGSGEITHAVTGNPAEPTYLGGGRAELKGRDRRRALADWIVSDDNPAFARNLANLVWAHHLGRGVVEPVDDVRISNPPSNGPLLELLGSMLIESDYDLRELVRQIVNSRTYQLSTRANETNAADSKYFSRAQVRRLRAEALLDSISQVTNTVDRFPRLPSGARSAQIADGAVSNYFLTTFGRAPRETVCACEVDVEPNLSQAFHLLNGDATNDKVLEGGVVESLLEEGRSPADVIQQLYLRCYSRIPTTEESSSLLAGLDSDDPRRGLNDIFWALLNSKEFIFNH